MSSIQSVIKSPKTSHVHCLLSVSHSSWSSGWFELEIGDLDLVLLAEKRLSRERMKSEQRRGQGQEPWGTIILKGERRKSRQRKLNRNSQSWKETKIKWCLEGQRGTFKKKRMVYGVQCSETQLDEGYRVSPGSPSTLTLPRPPLQKSEWFSPKCRSDQVTLCLNPSVADHCLQNKVHTPYLEFKAPH